MKFHLFILFILSLSCTNSFEKIQTPKGTAINASGFSRVISSIAADISIQMNADSPYHCYLNCEKAVEPLIEFNIVNDELHIGTKNDVALNTRQPLLISMSVKELKSIRNMGSGTFVVSGELKSDNFEIGNQGSGNIQIKNLQNNQLTIHCYGSGDVELDGKTKNMMSKIKGSGNIRAFGLQTETTEAAIMGSGNIETSVSSALDADIEGSGNIYYKGKPAVRNSITGSGIVSAR